VRAKWFLFGIIATLVVLSAAAYVYFEHGFVSTRADTKPGILDSWLSQASESSIERHALKTTNPEPDTYPTLIAAARVYGTRCAICHGSPAQQENQIGEAENPPAPQFFRSSPPNMTESQNYYVIKHGIRMTAMLPWDNLLSDQQIWQVVDLLKHVNNKSVPAEVTQQLNTASVTDVF
jgi:mono/diheme cytochrome c family protein